MKHLGLFEGIGGFSLAARWMGWETLAWCEWNEFGQKVLRHHFPEAEGFGDITKTDFTKYANRIDIITGGFPCQPYSLAGQRKGTEDERHLWPEMLRAIREVKPSWVVGENVFGLINWSGGLVFEQVQIDLEAEGYEVQAYILPACAKNAPHRRDRIWFVAYCNNSGNTTQGCGINGNKQEESQERGKPFSKYNGLSNTGTTPDPNSDGLNRCNSEYEINPSERGIDALNDFNEATMHTNCTSKQGEFNGPDSRNGFDNFQNFPTQSPVCNGDDGLSHRLDSITFPKWRSESIKAGGNAIVPQVAYEIFKAIDQYSNP